MQNESVKSSGITSIITSISLCHFLCCLSILTPVKTKLVGVCVCVCMGEGGVQVVPDRLHVEAQERQVPYLSLMRGATRSAA